MIALRGVIFGTIHTFYVYAQMVNSRDARVLHVQVRRPIMVTHHLHWFVAQTGELRVFLLQQGEYLGRIEPERFGAFQQGCFRNVRSFCT